MPPRTLPAVDLAEDVVEQDVGRSGGIGAGEVADHAVEAEDGLDGVALEPAVEIVPGALGEEIEQIPLLHEIEPAQPPPEPQPLQQLRTAAGHVGRRLPPQARTTVGP